MVLWKPQSSLMGVFSHHTVTYIGTPRGMAYLRKASTKSMHSTLGLSTPLIFYFLFLNKKQTQSLSIS